METLSQKERNCIAKGFFAERDSKITQILDKLTDNKYSDVRNPNHVIDAYGQMNIKKETFRKSNSWLHNEINFGYHNEINFGYHNEIYFSFGETPWFNPTKPLVMFGSNNPNFGRFLVYNFQWWNIKLMKGTWQKNSEANP